MGLTHTLHALLQVTRGVTVFIVAASEFIIIISTFSDSIRSCAVYDIEQELMFARAITCYRTLVGCTRGASRKKCVL